MKSATVHRLHTPKPQPDAVRADQWPQTKGNVRPSKADSGKIQRNRVHSAGRGAPRQRAIGANPIKKMAGAISGTITLSKNGAPTEIFPRSKASRTSG